MGKYIVLYHAPKSAMEAMANVTVEEMKEGMEPWMAWAGTCGDRLVDMGAPLRGGLKMTRSGTVASDKDVAGYSVLEAGSMDEAQALLEGHPHLEWLEGCEIEVHEAMSLPM